MKKNSLSQKKICSGQHKFNAWKRGRDGFKKRTCVYCDYSETTRIRTRIRTQEQKEPVKGLKAYKDCILFGFEVNAK